MVSAATTLLSTALSVMDSNLTGGNILRDSHNVVFVKFPATERDYS